jgi:hypothetical protein
VGAFAIALVLPFRQIGESPPVWSLRLVARIPPDKRLEFTQSVQSLLRGQDSPVDRAFVLQDVDDRSLFCWMADGEAPEGLRAFLDSSTFRALKGAAEVLGHIEELSVLESSGHAPKARSARDEN